jgi:hypothetical protein
MHCSGNIVFIFKVAACNETTFQVVRNIQAMSLYAALGVMLGSLNTECQ